MTVAVNEMGLADPIGARKLYWHQYVNALFELEALYSKHAGKSDLVDDYAARLLRDGIPHAYNLVAQERWDRNMPDYPVTMDKLNMLVNAWENHFPDDDSHEVWVEDIGELLTDINAVNEMIGAIGIMVRLDF